MQQSVDQAAAIIQQLGLEPHPEGGHYRETWRAPGVGRAEGTAIYFLLAAGESSHWHRIDSTEIWHHYAGSSLELRTWAEADATVASRILGPDLERAERPQLTVSPGEWQAARPLGSWSLVGCTVSPGFECAHFELAEPGWAPPAAGV